jgi:hypothetical protein
MNVLPTHCNSEKIHCNKIPIQCQVWLGSKAYFLWVVFRCQTCMISCSAFLNVFPDHCNETLSMWSVAWRNVVRCHWLAVQYSFDQASSHDLPNRCNSDTIKCNSIWLGGSMLHQTCCFLLHNFWISCEQTAASHGYGHMLSYLFA